MRPAYCAWCGSRLSRHLLDCPDCGAEVGAPADARTADVVTAKFLPPSVLPAGGVAAVARGVMDDLDVQNIGAITMPTHLWTVTLDDGRRMPLEGPAVFGRDPAPLPGETGIRLQPIADETRTVSKTHVKLEPATDAVLVTDRHSTNGVVVITAGVATRCRAGEPMVATSGSVVRFGDREMQVRRR